MNYEELVKNALDGDEDSFYTLIKEVQEKLYVVAYSYVLDRDEALDIVQEAIIKGYNSLDKLKEPKYFKSYITKILINLSIDRYKKQRKLVFLEDIKDEFLNKEENLEGSMDLKKAVMSLELKYRSIVMLKYYSDLTLKEIADLTKTPLGTVKTNLNKALKLLRIELKEEGVSNEWKGS